MLGGLGIGRCAIDTLILIFELLGSIGIFLLGMKLMSEGLQRVAGERLRSLLGKMTSTRITGVLTGVGITAIIQSSTATTVMVVSFVSAGLLSLTQAIGVIMGANVGTTLTAWLVSLLGFNVKITVFALPAIGLGMILGFMPGQKKKDWGEVLLGFGILFLGLALLKDSVPPIDDPGHLAFIQNLSGYGFFSLLIYLAIGTGLTLVLQSSTATMTLTLTMAAMGWLPYEMAVAMVLGENIGTTATANLAAIGASTDAKRAARVHLLFNLFGVVWALALFHVYLLPIVDFFVPGSPHVDALALQGDPKALAVASLVITTHLAAIHTVFNITNVLLMLPFVKQLEAIVTRWVPSQKQGDGPRLRFLSVTGIEAPELLIIQAGKEMQHMTEVVREMFRDVLKILTHPEEKLGPLVEATIQREDLVDELEEGIADILARSTTAGTSAPTARRVADMIQNVHRLERIGDHCMVLMRIASRTYDSGSQFRENDTADLKQLGELVDESLENLGRYLAGQNGEAVRRSEELEMRVDATRRELRAHRVQAMQESTEGIQAQLAFLDTITHLEEVADRVVGIIRQAEATRRAA